MFSWFAKRAIRKAIGILNKYISGPLAWYVIELLIDFLDKNLDSLEDLAKHTKTDKDDRAIKILREVVKTLRSLGL